MELTGQLTDEEWGKVGSNSVAGLFYWLSKKRNILDETTTYSSLIFNAMDASRTTFEKNYVALSMFIQEQPQALGKMCAKIFHNKLPFQIKIISMKRSKALGCTPDKVHAKRLHELYPGRYVDSKHKPKMIIALTDMEVLLGFRNTEDISNCLKDVIELSIIVPFEKIEDYLYSGKESHLKEIFYYLITATPLEVRLSLDTFFKRMEDADSLKKKSISYCIIEKLHSQHPYDQVVYAPLFLNHITARSGEALFISPGVPHAYINGDCFEVSTSTDNILRCGLTKKFRDCHEFIKIIDFTNYGPSKMFLKPIVVDQYLVSFKPPVTEYAVNLIKVPVGDTYTLPIYESCSIIVISRGVATRDDFSEINLGKALFVLPYQKISFTVKKDITIYSVFPNIEMFMLNVNKYDF